MTPKTFSFESSSSSKTYTAVIAVDGRLGCNCMGWSIKKGDQPRQCKHTKEVVRREGLRTERRGDYIYVVTGTPGPALGLAVATAPTAPSAPLYLCPKCGKPQPAKRGPRGDDQVATLGSGFVARFLACGHVTKVTDRPIGEGAPAPMAPAAPVRDLAAGVKAALDARAAGLVAPMLASPMPEGRTLESFGSDWALEEKYDGHRVVVVVSKGQVTAFSRPQRDRQALRRELPKHIEAEFSRFPDGTYDGELLIPNGHSYDVINLVHAGKEVFVTFDLLRLLDQDTTGETYDGRRAFLLAIFAKVEHSSVVLAESGPVSEKRLAAIWAAGGEGVMLKRRASRYQPGKRSADFIKVKRLRSAVLTVTGFKAGKLGPHATVLLRDSEGNDTKVKTLNSAALREFAAGADRFIGRKLRIEFQERTPDGNYRHPRWDRWENE